MPAPKPNSTPIGDTHTIQCLFCHQRQEVARRAMSITCKFCHKRLKVEATSVTHYEAWRQFATCGLLTVEKAGTVVADVILCGRLVVRGKVKGKIESQGPVLIGRDAEVNGDVTAPALAVGAGAVLKGRYEIGPKSAETSVPTPPAHEGAAIRL